MLTPWYQAEAPRRAVAWLTLDGGDNDLVVCLPHVLEALRRVCPDIGDSVSYPAAGAPLVIEMMLPRLVNALDVHQGRGAEERTRDPSAVARSPIRAVSRASGNHTTSAGP